MRNERVEVPIVVNTVSKATVSVENASTCDGLVVKSSSMQPVSSVAASRHNEKMATVIALIVL